MPPFFLFFGPAFICVTTYLISSRACPYVHVFLESFIFAGVTWQEEMTSKKLDVDGVAVSDGASQ